MALISPGVQVSVIDESFYTASGAGTRPLFIVASAGNKTNAAGTGKAVGTLSTNAGKVYTITSQRDLVDTFGIPSFKVDINNNPIHAGELNEYGLQAAYSYLGVANSVLVARADLDLDKLQAKANAPGGSPIDGTFWLDTSINAFGIFEWNGERATRAGGQTFTSKTPVVVLDSTLFDQAGPIDSFGAVGSYAVVPGNDPRTEDENLDQATSHVLSIYYKSRFNSDGTVGQASWVKVGSSRWRAAIATVQGSTPTPATSGDQITINGTIVTVGSTALVDIADLITSVVPGVGARVVDSLVQLYVTSDLVDSVVVSTGSAILGIAAGTYYAPKLTISKHTEVPTYKLRDAMPRPTGSVWIKTTEPNKGARWRLKQYNDATQLWTPVAAPLYASNEAAIADIAPTTGGEDIPVDSAYVQFNFNGLVSDTKPEADFRVMRRARSGATVVKSKPIIAGTFPAGATFYFNMAESVIGSAALSNRLISVTTTGYASASNAALNDAQLIAQAINSPSTGTPFTNIIASVDKNNCVVIQHRIGGEIVFADQGDSVNFVGTHLGLTTENTNVYKTAVEDTTYAYVASNWIPMTITPDTSTRVNQSYYISNTVPETLPANGELWYSSVVDEVDILVHNGQTWVGYLNPSSPYYNADSNKQTNPTGPIVSATEPAYQVDGTLLVDGDLWVDTSDLENYPALNRFNGDFNRWEKIDITDQTTENGILFADARWGTSGGTSNNAPDTDIISLLSSNFLDFDAPDPALYPRGMLLWNLRRSGFNVKKFVRNYVDTTRDNARYKAEFNDVGQRPTSGDSQEAYYPHRWVTESANQADGSGSFGRKAQRKVVIQSLQALVNSNQEIRDTERNDFNLLATPGYPELIGEMVNLNYDRGLTAFIIGDCPARLAPTATEINNWGTNVAGALEDNDKGLVTADEYLGVYYPWGITSDNFGREIAVPPSHMIARMISLSDSVSHEWFAPAGTRRGGITNATNVGYVTTEGEFKSAALNEGLRDTLYNVSVNPITYFVGAGLVSFGQKTRARNASAIDRINVARLVIYLRRKLNLLAKPYIFEPNDKITRDEIKQEIESLMLELMANRALYDFMVVCDESNNTPARIDRNELYVDIAIEPVKSVEFIYIPLRLKNTGEIAG